MRRTSLCRVLIPLMVMTLLLDATVSYAMISQSDQLDIIYGKGEQRILHDDLFSEQDAQYYPLSYNSVEETLAAAKEIAKEISDEGTVLLKNDGVLPLHNDQAISPLGISYFQPFYCGTGSAVISTRTEDVISPEKAIHAVFSRVNLQIEALQRSALNNDDMLLITYPQKEGEDQILTEFNAHIFLHEEELLQDTVGLIFISRRTGENKDAYTGAYEDGTKHMLSLTNAEKALLQVAKKNCSATVVILCSATSIEIGELKSDEGINAIIWQGGAGSSGYASIADILCGRVNPSGHLPITFADDFTQDPSFANQDDGSDVFTYKNAFTTQLSYRDTKENIFAPFHEYEEGIYIGYRYYETAEKEVVYPFGFGLSYTQFEQKITEIKFQPDEFLVTVQIKNMGNGAGKDAVQVYIGLPYTAFDKSEQVEKPSIMLASFGKTNLLQPGEEEIMHLSVPYRSISSYCFNHVNKDGTKGCYFLEEGIYICSLRSDAHTIIEEKQFLISDTVWYEGEASNQFEMVTEYMLSHNLSNAQPLSRVDWENTQPTRPAESDRISSLMVKETIESNDVTKELFTQHSIDIHTPHIESSFPISLVDLRGRTYDDPLWDTLLDQLSFDEPSLYKDVLFEAAYQTAALPAIQKPHSVERDGPQGLTLADQAGKNWVDGVCGYPAAPVMAATWNDNLMYRFGAMVAQEALWKNINGWYAPGLNILRSPFCGRAAEYYSEDPLLAGQLAAQVVSGAGDNGLSCAVKHFVLMEMETHRSPNTCTWLTEQALREIYLKPFEIVIKTAKKTIRCLSVESAQSEFVTIPACDFIMVADSAIGTLWCGANSALLTNVLRNEWGYQGTVISDMHMNLNAVAIRRILEAGCDAILSIQSNVKLAFDEYKTPAGRALIRQAVKNLCYTQVNSNLMQGIAPGSLIQYGMSAWRKGLLVANSLVGLMLLAGIMVCCMDKKRNK